MVKVNQGSSNENTGSTRVPSAQDQDQDSLLVKRQNDNHSPGPVSRELVPSSHQRSEFSNTILCIFSRPSAVYQVSRSSPLISEEEDFLSFSPYMGMVMWPGTFEQIFIPHIPWSLHMKFGFNRPSGFWAKEVWKCWIWVTLDEGQWMTLIFDIHKDSCTHLVDRIYQIWYHRLQ